MISDFASVESYKAESVDSVIEHFKVVASFPRQIIILLGTQLIGTLDPNDGPVSDRMIDLEQTSQFPSFSIAMAMAHHGDPGIIAQIVERRQWAQDHLSVMADRVDSRETMATVRKLFSPDQWKTFARGEPFTTTMQGLFHAAILTTAEAFATGHPSGLALPTAPALHDHFVFRLALCHVIHLIDMAGGGTVTRNAKQALNDRVDVFHAAYATYFNGLMTSDERAARTHIHARKALRSLGATLAEDYADSMQGMVVDLINDRRAKAGMPLL
ncbi:hypothetical protein [Sphingomonas endolithica]|uniref:hypothetical protein n=1 Tax=Sphingomonas endolithica TaxID=2972485 RepID=UPI0021AFA72C|nr:hypothetical protein [Sphingomonas sp. ZFBP2030]